MKTFELKNGNWYELKSIIPTEEETVVLNTEDESLTEQQKAILAKLNFTEPVEEKESTKLEELYQSLIPTDPGEYELIGINISKEGDEYFGILNCRINGEHKQVRF